MHIVFNSIRWKNFLSTGNAWVTVPLSKHPLMLIHGKNGSGKSTLLDALCFVLYNKPFRKVNKSQLVNTVNKKDCLVEVAFTIGKHTYIVRRGIKPNIFQIYCDKELVPEEAANGDYQAFLEDIVLQSKYKTFCQVNILGSAKYVAFMELEARDRRVVVEDLLDTRIYSVMLALAKDEMKTGNAKLVDIRGRLDVVRFQIDAQKKLIERQQFNQQAQIEEIDQKIAAIDVQIAEYQRQIDLSSEVVQQYTDECNRMLKDPGKVETALYDLRSQIQSNNLTIRRLKNDLTKVEGDVCSQCGQAIDHNHRDHIVVNTNAECDKFEQHNALLQKRVAMVEQLLAEYNQLKGKEQAALNKLNSLISAISQANNIRSLHVLERTQTSNKVVESVDVNELNRLESELVELTSEYDEVYTSVVVIKKCIDMLGDDGLKAETINKYIPVINKSINQYLERMDLFAEFELDQEFSETIKSRYRDTFSYHSFSEGQKMRIDLAILFTWREVAKLRNSVSSNLLIMDEVLDRSLDSEGKQDFLMLLKVLTDVQNTIIITHDAELAAGFDKTIAVQLNGNFTEYEAL